MNYKILDCTLRDGGYYNNWDFSSDLVKKYLKSMAETNIDYVELGLRNFPKSEFLGAFAYTTEIFLNSLDLPKGPVYGVMVDAKTILKSNLSINDAINKLFVDAKDSKIDLVRVAAHIDEIKHSYKIIEKLKKLGYEVGLNIMQAGGKSDKVILDLSRLVSEWKELDILYFADSLGNMDTNEVKRINDLIRRHWKKTLGIHTHDNLGQGLNNTLKAIDLGICLLDCTVTGMGRGAGNTQTERLLTVLNNNKYNKNSIYELVIRYFEPMQKIYGWGTNLLYFLGAKNEVHPTYIQNILSNSHYGTDEIVGAIDYFSKFNDSISFDETVLRKALNYNNTEKNKFGDSTINGIFNEKNILIIANSPNTVKHKEAIEVYINKEKPIVISINITDIISKDLIDYYVVSHNTKFFSQASLYKQIDKPVIMPRGRFSDEELKEINGLEIYDYGLEIKTNNLCSNSNYATIPHDITSAYALCILMQSNVSSISVVGFDGYDNNDIRQEQMIEILNLYNDIDESRKIIALTPTTYPIRKSSIYAIS